MARTVVTPDSGKYNRPAQIQAPAAYVDNGSGGNANAGLWNTVRSPMILLTEAPNGRGLMRPYQYQQLYPQAHHWAEFWYASDVPIDATMMLLVDNRRYQILGAIDQDSRQVITLLALVEYQAKGSI